MCCFVALLAFLSPRLAIIAVWLFTNKMTVAFESGWIGLIGFLFLPWTTLAWTFLYVPYADSVQGFGWVVLIFAFVVDISTYVSGAAGKKTAS